MGNYVDRILEDHGVPRSAVRLEQASAVSGEAIYAELFPLLAATKTRQRPFGYYESELDENGGIHAARSYTAAKRLELVYPWTAAEALSSAERFLDYRSGLRGSGLFWLGNPDAYGAGRNLFEPRFASPRLIELDAPNIGVATPSWGATAANSYDQPARKGTWDITTAANATPLTDTTIPYTIIPIPPEYTLHIGVTGAATGTAVVRVESWVNGAAAAGATASLTLLGETVSTRLNTTVVGSTYAYAKVFMSRTSSATSTLTWISGMAQLHLTGVSPTLTGLHLPGLGWGGLDFADDSVPVQLQDASTGRHYKGVTVKFDEVGPWR